MKSYVPPLQVLNDIRPPKFFFFEPSSLHYVNFSTGMTQPSKLQRVETLIPESFNPFTDSYNE